MLLRRFLSLHNTDTAKVLWKNAVPNCLSTPLATLNNYSGNNNNRSFSSSSSTTAQNENPSDNATTINNDEVKKFSDASNDWWGFANNNTSSKNTDTVGPLHLMNPCRVKYICRRIKEFQNLNNSNNNNYDKKNKEGQQLPLSGLKILDVGCGGGILSESLARLGGDVTGLDASLPSIEAARLHSGLNASTKNIRYVHGSVEEYVADAADDEKFDIVCALEIVEHVNNPNLFLNECAKLLKEKDSHLFISTLNRTSLSYFLSIMMAEDVLQMVPSGTHDWSKYIQPDELNEMLNDGNDSLALLQLRDIVGMQYNPVLKKWYENDKDVNVNYIAHLGC